MMRIESAIAILLQPMLKGTELFAGAKYEDKFGHLILCGMGGVFIEVMKDVSQAISPVCPGEALNMIRSLKSYGIIQGVRGRKGLNEQLFAEIILKLSALCQEAPEIDELDLNPLLGDGDSIIAVDARISISSRTPNQLVKA
jgi:acetate---CoA ligase (ADP-forming)